MKVNIKNSELKVKIDTEKTKSNLINLTVSPTDNTQIFNHPNSDGYDVVTVEGIESEQVQIIPTKSEQIYNGLYNTINVDPIPEQYIIPEGTIDINESGTVDVKDYEYAYVNIDGGDPVYKIIGNNIDILGMKKGTYVLDMSSRNNTTVNLYYSSYREGSYTLSIDLSNGCLFIFEDVTEDLPVNTVIGTYVTASSGTYYCNSILIRGDSSGVTTSGRQVFNFVDNSTQSVFGVKTFIRIPKQSSTEAPTQDTEFTNKKYVDDSIASAITDALGGSY